MSAELEAMNHVEVSLVPGSGGIFDVLVDGKLIFSKNKTGRFPNEGEISKLV